MIPYKEHDFYYAKLYQSSSESENSPKSIGSEFGFIICIEFEFSVRTSTSNVSPSTSRYMDQ